MPDTSHLRLLVVCIVWILTLSPFQHALAQSQKKLALEEAVQLGIENSKNLKVSQLKIDLIENKIDQLKNTYIPNVNLSAQYNRLSNNIEPFVVQLGPGVTKTLNPQILNQFSNRASLSYSVFNGFRLINTIENIKFLEKATQLDVEKDQQEIKYNIINAYFNIQKLNQSKQSILKSIELTDARLKDVQNMQQNGLALEVDVMKAALNKSNVEMLLDEIKTSLEISLFNFNLLLGLPTETALDLTTQPSHIGRSDDVAVYIENAFKNRSELQSISNRQKASESAIKIAKGNVYPVFSIGGNLYYNNPNQRVFPNEEKFKGTWDAGAMLTWTPSSIYTNKAVVNEAKLNTQQIQFSKDLLYDGIKTEVYSNYKSYKLSLQKIELAAKANVYAIENEKILQNKVDNQINVLTDLTDADVLKIQSEINMINANIDAALAYQKLLKSIGE